MKRKVNRVGQNTLTVSLPSRWAKKHGVKPGDEVDVLERGNILEIDVGHGLLLSEYHEKIDRTTRSIMKSMISNAYKVGYDKIILEYKDEATTRDIQRIVDTLLGVEIISKTKNSCEIKNVSREMEKEHPNILKSSFIMTLELSEEIFNLLKKTDFSQYDDIAYKKQMITKYTDFCKRIQNKHMKNNTKVIFQYLIVWSLEKIANEYKYIYRYCDKYNAKRFSSALMDYFSQTNKLLQLYYQAYYEKNMKKIENLAKMKDNLLFHEYYDIQTRLNKYDGPILHHLANIIRRLWDMSGPFYGLNA